MQKPSDDLQQTDTRWLDPEAFEYLCFNLARELLTYNEPIPDYETHDDALLQSALGAPKQTFGGNLLYPTLVTQSSILFYSLIKNHPFKNGNKRIAVMALLAFLSINKKWLMIKPDDLYELALHVSISKADKNNETIKEINKIIEDNLIDSK